MRRITGCEVMPDEIGGLIGLHLDIAEKHGTLGNKNSARNAIDRAYVSLQRFQTDNPRSHLIRQLTKRIEGYQEILL